MASAARPKCRVSVGITGLTEAVAREGIPWLVEALSGRTYFSDVSARWDEENKHVRLQLVVSD